MSTPRRARRTADEVNEEIRALWQRARGRLDAEQRREYQRLVMEWAAAAGTGSSAPREGAPPRGGQARDGAVSRRGPVRAA
ncbi:hypothetical protein [Streptomyces cavernae]|uniref:hypothetical protein n=1 Tax=Streptomyces cavernae TaxID=2259034 RepID=UPI001391CEB1|nr:hypothetical protein [Streptomyces cavernae]